MLNKAIVLSIAFFCMLSTVATYRAEAISINDDGYAWKKTPENEGNEFCDDLAHSWGMKCDGIFEYLNDFYDSQNPDVLKIQIRELLIIARASGKAEGRIKWFP